MEEQTEAMKDFVSMMNEEGLISEYESAVMRLDTEIKCFSLDYNIETEFLDIPSGVDFSNLDIPEEIKPYIEKGEYQSVYAFNIPTDLKPYFEEFYHGFINKNSPAAVFPATGLQIALCQKLCFCTKG